MTLERWMQKKKMDCAAFARLMTARGISTSRESVWMWRSRKAVPRGQKRMDTIASITSYDVLPGDFYAEPSRKRKRGAA